MSLWQQYRTAIRDARKRVKDLPSRFVETRHGPLEYMTFGRGRPVLQIHGVIGGCDQGLVNARAFVGEDFFSIIPSRFGYLGTPMPAVPTPVGQADTYIELLDTLDIQKAAIIGVSAGGASAMQFALRHPGRCSALVLQSSTAPWKKKPPMPPKPIANILYRSDFLFWLLVTHLSRLIDSYIGVPKGMTLTPLQQGLLEDLKRTLLPVSARAAGALFDGYVSNVEVNTYKLEEINVPTIILHALDDTGSPYVNAQAVAERIPGAELVTLQRGGHLLTGQDGRVRSEISRFLTEHP